MKDIQSQRDHRRININKVGVKDISYPITVLDKANKTQKTVARVNMYVNLPHLFKGTHMSRFIEILNCFHGEINLKSFHSILAETKKRLQAEEAHMEIEFPFFLKKETSRDSVGMGEYVCRMHGSLAEENDLVLGIRVPIASPLPEQIDHVLPRSLGHWGVADISLRFARFIWIEDLIQMVEEVTAHNLSWRNGDFLGQGRDLSVENISKALGEKLKGCQDISWFSIKVENLSEGYSTFSSLEWPEGN